MGLRRSLHLLPDTVLTVYCLQGSLADESGLPPFYIGAWEEDGHVFLFFLEPADDAVAALCRRDERLELLDRITMTYRQWQGVSPEPLKIGRFLLNPPWLKKTPAAGEIGLSFDPGLVFGTGTHPTTLACLQAIEIACLGGTVRTMLDLGTGTGLLSLVAAHCGCRRVLAVDNNLLAARTARRNVRLNKLDEVVSVINGCAVALSGVKADLLVANIDCGVLRHIVEGPGLLRQKWFVLSGLKHREAHSILELLAEKPVAILKRWTDDPIWQTIMGITTDVAPADAFNGAGQFC